MMSPSSHPLARIFSTAAAPLRAMASLTRATVVRIPPAAHWSPVTVPAGQKFPSTTPPVRQAPGPRAPSSPDRARARTWVPKRHYSPPATPAKHAKVATPLTGEPPAGVSGSHMNANIPEALDAAFANKGRRWMEVAASDSEAIVKAERDTKAGASVQEMQKETVNKFQREQ